MSKVTAPLLGFGASGAIGKTMVYGAWKGIKYARQHVIPANPQSTEQMKTRDVFAWLSAVWKTSPSEFQAAFDYAAKGKPLTNRNVFISKNIPVLRVPTVLTGMVLSPGAFGGIEAADTLTGAAGQITVDVAVPAALPSGWTITRAIAAAVLQQDPHVDTDYTVVADVDDAAPYSIVLDGLAAGTYVAAGWLEYQRSALATDLAYGPAVGAAVVVT